MGLNCKNNNAEDLAKKLLQLCEDDVLRKTKSLNSRRLAEERFDRQLTYLKIVDLIMKTN